MSLQLDLAAQWKRTCTYLLALFLSLFASSRRLLLPLKKRTTIWKDFSHTTATCQKKSETYLVPTWGCGSTYLHVRRRQEPTQEQQASWLPVTALLSGYEYLKERSSLTSERLGSLKLSLGRETFAYLVKNVLISIRPAHIFSLYRSKWGIL